MTPSLNKWMKSPDLKPGYQGGGLPIPASAGRRACRAQESREISAMH